MKASHIGIGVVILYFVAAAVFRPFVIQRATPPLKAQFDEIAEYTYAYFDRHGEIPTNTEYLPTTLRELLRGSTAISWDASQQTYRLSYQDKYPVNISSIEILSFGLIKSRRTVTGAFITPDMIRTNTPLYKESGQLPALP